MKMKNKTLSEQVSMDELVKRVESVTLRALKRLEDDLEKGAVNPLDALSVIADLMRGMQAFY